MIELTFPKFKVKCCQFIPAVCNHSFNFEEITYNNNNTGGQIKINSSILLDVLQNYIITGTKGLRLVKHIKYKVVTRSKGKV